MNVWTDAIIILVVLVNLRVLGSSRIASCIRTVAFQGIVLGLLPLVAGLEGLTARMILAATASTALKGIVFPWLLMRAIRGSDERHEVNPIVGFTTSLAAGIAMIAAALWIGQRMPTPAGGHWLVLPAASFTILVGLFMIVARKQAVIQVLGYLILENGIYTFGMAMSRSQPLMVELGILLDVFMAVFVMGITIYHMHRQFDHTDTERMSSLKD